MSSFWPAVWLPDEVAGGYLFAWREDIDPDNSGCIWSPRKTVGSGVVHGWFGIIGGQADISPPQTPTPEWDESWTYGHIPFDHPGFLAAKRFYLLVIA